MAASSGAATYNVNSIPELQSAIDSAAPGDRIILANGVYTNSGYISVGCAGSATNPITIEAEGVGGAEIIRTHGFRITSTAAYVTVKGFKFTHTSGRNLIASGAVFCGFTHNIFDCTGSGDYLVVSADDSEIGYNEFRNRSEGGQMITVNAVASGQIARRTWIHHNYFHDYPYTGWNGSETIKLGLGNLSPSVGNAVIEYNLFDRCDGEIEMLSNKSSGNTYRYNTLRDATHATLTLRGGDDCVVYGNFFLNVRGMRVFGERHQIFSNYFNNRSWLEMEDAANLDVVYNTFVNCEHYRMDAGRTCDNVNFSNNILQGFDKLANANPANYTNGVWSNNIAWDFNTRGHFPASGLTEVDPMLAQDAQGIYRLQAGSPAINAGVGSYPFATVDMDDQPRNDGTLDIGADEYSSPAGAARVLTPADVGPVGGPPRGLSVIAASSGSASIDWDDSNDPDFMHYNVYRSSPYGIGYALVNTGLTVSDYVDNSVSNAMIYYYKVTAVNTDGNESGFSDEAVAKMDPHLVGGSLFNGDFNSNPGGSNSFASLDAWENIGSGNQNAGATATDKDYDGSRNAAIGSQTLGSKIHGLDTGHTIAEGDVFGLAYFWRDAFGWDDASDRIRVSLFVTDDDTIGGARTDLVVDLSELSTQNNTYESVAHPEIYTASAANAGKRLFVAFDSKAAANRYARLDNFELLLQNNLHAQVPHVVVDERFTAAEGYSAGDLVGHPDWGAHSGYYTVDPAGVGAVVLDGSTAAWKKAFHKTPLSSSNYIYTLGIEFTFDRGNNSPNGPKDLIGLDFSEVNGTGGARLGVTLERQMESDPTFELHLADAMGETNYSRSGPFGETDLGFEVGVDNDTSDLLYLEFKLVRGEDAGDWQAWAKLVNLATGEIVKNQNWGILDTDESFFTGDLYGKI
ncbi:MAG: chondroitinase-B domain-containing protein, partial [Verrucomicrobiota bacterium]